MMALPPKLAAKVAQAGLTTPTPIQAQAIPHAMNGRDVMGLAQTGTGKTAAFGIPLIARLMEEGGRPAPKTARGLVLAPTRELAAQIAKVLRDLTDLRVQIVVGGVSITPQIPRLTKGADIMVATPGRLLDLVERRAIRLDETGFLVLDEAFADVMPGASVLPHAGEQNIVVLRSFGKFFGLAGLRLGFLAGPKEIVDRLGARLESWCVSGPALDIGTQALRDQEWQEKMVRRLAVAGFAAAFLSEVLIADLVQLNRFAVRRKPHAAALKHRTYACAVGQVCHIRGAGRCEAQLIVITAAQCQGHGAWRLELISKRRRQRQTVDVNLSRALTCPTNMAKVCKQPIRDVNSRRRVPRQSDTQIDPGLRIQETAQQPVRPLRRLRFRRKLE